MRLASALVVVLAAAVAGPSASAQVFRPTTFTLANGLQVVVVENHRAPIVTHMVWYRAGAADEAPGKSGIAHFLEHLMFKGTADVPPGEMSKIVARNGGRDNAFTSWDYTGYFQSVARDRLELMMRLEADRMTGLILTDAVVLPERDVILEERRQVVDNVPSARLREQLGAAMFVNHPYGRPIIGWEHEIRGLTRDDAIVWYRTWYAPNNAVLIVAGDVTADEVRGLAERYYGPIPARPVPARLRPAEPPPQAARRVVLKDERVRQPSWTRSFLAPSQKSGETEHAYPLQILADILGSQSGRLYRALVVDKQIAVSAGAAYDDDAVDLSSFLLYASPRQGRTTDEVERAMEAEIATLLRDGVSDQEVERAKTRMAASSVLARDAVGTAPRVIGAALMGGLTIEEIEAWPQRIAAVTPAQVTAAARAVLQEPRSVTGHLLTKEAP
ncbi:MAG: insulinase family protein [Alphaproteobacteria bacterium]|nr:insulinase family protein [Alphaproteobacteria bacterium]